MKRQGGWRGGEVLVLVLCVWRVYLLSVQCPQCTLQHRRMMAHRHTAHDTTHDKTRIALFCSTSHTAHEATHDNTATRQHYNTTTHALLSLLLYALDGSSTHAEVDLYKRICPQRISRSDLAAECLSHCTTTTTKRTKRREGGVQCELQCQRGERVAFSVSHGVRFQVSTTMALENIIFQYKCERRYL